MLIVYISLTGNVRDFVERTGLNSIEIDPVNLQEVNEYYIVVVPSYVGYINDEVSSFIDYKSNLQYLKGFAASGNRNFNKDYCVNGKFLSTYYKKPLMFTFEYSGTDQEVENFIKEVAKY